MTWARSALSRRRRSSTFRGSLADRVGMTARADRRREPRDHRVLEQTLHSSASQERHGDQVLDVAVPACSRLGRLDQPVHVLHRTVGEPRGEVREDPRQVSADRRRRSLERLKSRATCPRVLERQQRLRLHGVLGQGEDVAKTLLQSPRSSRAGA